MKNSRIKRLLALFTTVVMMFTMVAGCGSDDSEETKKNSGVKDTAVFTKAAYVGMLGDKFGYNEYETASDIYSDVSSDNAYYSRIQACSEWDVIEKTEKFEPNEDVTLKYALESAVKAVGIDRLRSAGKNVDENDLMTFYTGNIAEIDVSDPDAVISSDTATKIIGYAKQYKNSLELPQKQDIVLNESVKDASTGMFLNDDTTGTMPDSAGYKVGDIVYWESKDGSLPTAVKITEINGNQFKYENPELEEIFDSINISGTYEGKVISATSASDGTNVNYGQDLYNEVHNYGLGYIVEDDPLVSLLKNGIKTETGDNYVRFTASADGASSDNSTGVKTHADFVAEITDIKVTIDYKVKKILIPTMLDARVSFNTKVSSNISGSFNKSIPLGEVKISICGPLMLKLKFTANIGANGEIDIAYTTSNALDVEWKKGTGLSKSFDQQSVLDFEAEVTLTAELNTLADISLGVRIFGNDISKSLINAEVTTGVVAIAKVEADLLSDGLACSDVLIYVPLRWGLNQRSCLLTDVSDKLKYKATVWDSKTSPVQLHFHFEDGKRTEGDVCNKGEEEKVEQENVDENGNPFDELELFDDFEVIDFDFIKLNSYHIFVGEGETASVSFKSIPEGYTESDLIYEVSDSAICSVNGGSIIGASAGSTVVKVKTSDGMFSASFAVTVNEDYSMNFDNL